MRIGVLGLVTGVWLGAASPAWAMQVFVHTWLGQTVALEVESTDSVENVKAKVQDKTGVPVAEQILTFGGQILESGRTLADYDVRKEQTLELTIAVQEVTAAGVPMWHLSYGRASASAVCEPGWDPSWEWWPHGNTGGFVCNRVVRALG